MAKLRVRVLEDLAEPVTDLPPLDRPDAPVTNDLARSWTQDGYAILRGLIPTDTIDAYCQRYQLDAVTRMGTISNFDAELAAGYGIGTPYVDVPEIRDVCLHDALVPVLNGIHGAEMGLHLNLTGWRSTQRAYHQDAYLSPPYVGWWYAAAWIALDDIHPAAGPFEFVPGSHRWPSISQARMLDALGEDGTDPDWPWRSEAILGPLFDHEIAERGAEVRQFIAGKGDVLLWHPNLCHRGSTPTDPTLQRRALISHYSVIERRHDMPRWETHRTGRYYTP